jgi:cytochrome c oxidase subunit II
VACSAPFGSPAGGTDQAVDMRRLWTIFFVAGVAVGGLTLGLILWSAIRYRRRDGDESLPPQFREHVPIEIAYVAIPVGIVIALFLVTVSTERRVDRIAAPPDVVVHVQGFQWQWRFDYDGLDVSVIGTPAREPTLVLPVGETVLIELTSADVIHSFFVPGFLFKRDAVPGIVNRFEIVPRALGQYRGACAEFCGLGHASMDFIVRIVSLDDFRAWATTQGGATPG